MNAENVLMLRKADIEFIKMIQKLPPENQALARGIVIGMNFQKNRDEPKEKIVC